MADDFVDHFFEVDHFMERCLKFKREMEAVMATYKVAYKDMQKEAKQREDYLLLHKAFSFLLCHAFCVVTLTTFSQERRRHPNKHQH
jgi:hypothetical protein